LSLLVNFSARIFAAAPVYCESKGEFSVANETGVTTSRATFKGDGKEVKAFIARPDKVAEAPAVIIVHEWWGLNPHIEDVAQRYAREGFIGVAVDLYDGVITKDPKEAADLMSALKLEDGIESLKIVLTGLRANPEVTSVGVTGFCMGGTFALLLACHAKVEASAPFYGDVPVDTTLIGKLHCPVLFIGGEKDQWITVEKMKRLDTALKQYAKPGEVRVYKDADHAFFNDTRPEVYSQTDAENAWQRVIEFFNKHLRQGHAASA
jgi:carboxymethylenebutenolidase